MSSYKEQWEERKSCPWCKINFAYETWAKPPLKEAHKVCLNCYNYAQKIKAEKWSGSHET